MKAKFLRDEEITHPGLKSQADVIEWRRRLDNEEITPQEWRAGMFLKVKAGTVIDHPHAHRLVLMGMATPHDKECLERCKRLRVDPEVTAQGQDNTRLAQLTGDPNLDRDDASQAGDEDLDEGLSTITIPASTLSTSDEAAEPTVIVGNTVLEVPVPLDQQLSQAEGREPSGVADDASPTDAAKTE